MRAEFRLAGLALTAGLLAAAPCTAQRTADSVLLAKHADKSIGLKIWAPGGTLILKAWDRDSVDVRGRVASDEHFFGGGDARGMKFGLEPAGGSEPAGQSSLVVYVPRSARVSVKAVTARIEASGVSGSYYSVSGSMHLSGSASSIEAETMTGSLDLDLAVPWLRARTGDGHLMLRGAPEDVDVSTVGGTLDVMATSIKRGQLGSVSGDIHYAASPAGGAILEFSSHSGNVELILPSSVSGVFALSTVTGAIENRFPGVRPAAAPRSLRLNFGHGGAQVTVRTYKGAIRVRPQ
ncbi:MAG TPA: DUF4097 family beta strand repeat-containing protein [Gemmatimonadaceae bacterium]|nr:DUF4097 family beta strand repeat-containing protein [Gemmatimonadaceae bacterium]